MLGTKDLYKRVAGTGLVGLLLLVAPACALGASLPVPTGDSALPTVWSAPSMPDTGTLYLSGEGSVRVAANRVRIRLAVETEASSAAEAATLNAAQTSAVFAALRPLLADDDRMETSGYQLTTVYAPRDREDTGNRVIGYRTLNHVTVVLADVEMAGPVLDAAIASGVNRVAELSFFASDLSEAQDEALRRAIAQARHQAMVISDALGVPLGAILEVRSGVSAPSVQRESMQFEMARADATPIEAGSQVVTASVSITWRLGSGEINEGMR